MDSPAGLAWTYGSKDQDREMGAILGARPIDQCCARAQPPKRRVSKRSSANPEKLGHLSPVAKACLPRHVRWPGCGLTAGCG
jgi:hypothetical protein